MRRASSGFGAAASSSTVRRRASRRRRRRQSMPRIRDREADDARHRVGRPRVDGVGHRRRSDPFRGVLAVVAYTTTSLAKLYSEAIEGIDRGPVDAITATGATRLQILRYGVLPQVLPLFLSYVLYRLETNIRAATILGFVGAGGLGFYLQA